MDCSRFEELIDSYIEGSLSDEEKSDFQLHMNGCASCKDSFEFSSVIYNTMHSLQPISVPDNFLSELNNKLDIDIARKKPMKAFFKLPVKYYGAAACVLLAVALSFNNTELLKSLTAPEPETTLIQSSDDVTETQKPLTTTITPEVNQPGTEQPEITATSDAERETELPTIDEKAEPVAKAVKAERKASQKPSKAKAKPVTVSVKPSEAPVATAKPVTKKEIEEVKKKIDSQTNTGRVVIASAVENAVVISEESVENTAREVDYLKSYTLVKEAAETRANPAVVGLAQLENVEVVSDSVIKYTDHDGSGNVGAVGNSVIVYKRDADKISDILGKFYTRECGEFYVISDSEYKQFLHELEENGIDYKKSDLGKSESEDVMFKLVIA